MFFICDNETIPLLPTHRKTTSLRYTVHAGKVRSWTNLETLGNLLYTYYSVWFLVPSLILLVAMIGAIVLTMHRTTRVKRQDVFRRNALDSRRTIMRRTTDQIDISLTPPVGPVCDQGRGSRWNGRAFATAHDFDCSLCRPASFIREAVASALPTDVKLPPYL
ncbi:hypothetical protein IEQ34_026225 [Dendrobium chrysotoxum]|uniref:NADH-ubiquinone oxidoreductase chain 6 n=1 Tax=Dendrobium chrysotoxum TaxID=161865 RepID=A0AAV7FMT1_DENCH|nr:hypothetical protein IEQ34_026225 [Dendrobium chrysotoxum]